MAGVTIANEIRAIASGLAGKRLDAIQVKDLMIDTSKGGSSEHKSGRKLGSARKASSADSDRAAAESYYKAWSRSIQSKLKDAEHQTNPKRASRSRSNR